MSIFLRKTSLLCLRNQHLNTAVKSLGCLEPRGYKRWVRPTLKEFYKRRLAQGPEPERPRSAWVDWNYDAEVFGFGKRLGEDFTESTLKTAFMHKSYVEKEQAQRGELGLDESILPLSLEDNAQLSNEGRVVTEKYIMAYLSHAFPDLPVDGKEAMKNYVTSEQMLAYIASNLGVKDLIFCAEFPPEPSTMADTLMAVIGALNKDQGPKRAHLFVQDFIVTQLKGKELMDMWIVVNPMGLLCEYLEQQGMAEPEPRLLWEAGSSTVMATYVVGIYSNKKLLGQSPGETLTIAEEMAARDALRNIFGLKDNAAALKFGDSGHKLAIECL